MTSNFIIVGKGKKDFRNDKMISCFLLTNNDFGGKG